MTHVEPGDDDIPAPRAGAATVTARWILEFHDAWSRVTMNSFYARVEGGRLSDSQYAEWVRNRARVAVAVAQGAASVQDALAASGGAGRRTLPLCAAAEADAQRFLKLAQAAGAGTDGAAATGPGGGHTPDGASPPAGAEAVRGVVDRLVRFIEEATARSSPLVVAVAVLWGYMCVTYQAWALCQDRAVLPNRFIGIAEHLLRDAAIKSILASQDILDGFLADAGRAGNAEKAKSAFEDVLKLVNDILDQTLYIGEQGQAPLCVCGRKGHLPPQCTFKSHI